MAVLIELMLVLRDCFRLLAQSLLGKRQIALKSVVRVAAPRDVIWEIMTARTGQLEGTPPIDLRREPVSDQGPGNVYRTHTQCGEAEWETVYRVIDERAQESQFAELIYEGDTVTLSEKQSASHMFGFELNETAEGVTELTSVHELDGWRFADALTLAMTMRFMQRRVKLTCERRAARMQPATGDDGTAKSGVSQVRLAEEPGFEIDVESVNLCFAFTGVMLIFCGALVGVGQAAILLGAFVWHGYAITFVRRLTGRETPLIGLLPLTWQYAVTENDACGPLEQAFHSLAAVFAGMLPAAGLAFAYSATGLQPLAAAAFIFAALNLLHLMPMLPFAGGRLAVALMNVINDIHRRALCSGLLAMACFTAVFFGAYIFAALIAAGAFQLSAWNDGLLDIDGSAPEDAPAETDSETAGLILAGYFALVGAGVVIVAQLVTEERLWPILSGLTG